MWLQAGIWPFLDSSTCQKNEQASDVFSALGLNATSVTPSWWNGAKAVVVKLQLSEEQTWDISGGHPELWGLASSQLGMNPSWAEDLSGLS